MHTTLNKIRAHHPCKSGGVKMLKYLGKTKADDEPLAILTILESNGLDDALWCLRAVDGHDTEIRKLTCDFALSVAHLWDMPVVVRQYLETQSEEIRAVARAAQDAAGAAARAAAMAASLDAALDARAAAMAAARDAAAMAAAAAYHDAVDACGDAARADEREKQETMLRTMLEKGETA